jgi:hypothetical protein
LFIVALATTQYFERDDNVNRSVLLFLMVLWASSLPTVAQSPTIDAETGRSYPEIQPGPDPPKRPLAFRNVWVSEYRPNSNEEKLLEASAADELKFAEFLRLPDTGLMRMFPPVRRRVVSVTDLEDGFRPGFSAHASLYSFSKAKHGNCLQGYVDPRLGWAELRLLSGRFIAGFTGESLGVLVALGDVPLETITADTFGVTGLTNIIPPADYLEATSLSRRNRAGFEMERFRYGSSLPVVPDTTYVLRSTSNKRADLLVAFRVVRLDEGDGVTLLWRKLKSYPKPSWKRRPPW